MSNVSAITLNGERILKQWFIRQAILCNSDPQLYDFDHNIDRSLTYVENKMIVISYLNSVCPPKTPTKKEFEAMEREAHKCSVCGCTFGFSKRLNSTAQEQLKSHLAYERKLGRYTPHEEMTPEEVAAESRHIEEAGYDEY